MKIANEGLSDSDNLLMMPPNTPQLQTRVYKRRWLILIIYFFLNLSVNTTQYSFTSIANIVEDWYHINELEVNMLVVVFLCSGFTVRFFAMYVIDKYGLQVGIIISSLLNIVGGLLRWYPGGERYGYYSLLIGQILCASALAFMDISAPKFAANWFPPNQRTTATALGSGPIFVAVLVGYLSAPNIVKTGEDISYYMFLQAMFAIIFGAINIVFFRGNPPIPPSYSAASEKMEIKQAITTIFKDRNFVIMFFVFCIGGGAAIVYSVQFPEMVLPEGYNDKEGGLFGAAWIAGMIVAGGSFSPVVDKTHNYKMWIMISLVLVTISNIILNLLFSVFKLNYVIIAVASALSGCCWFALPAIIEATIETTYPIPEATVMGILFSGLNMMGVIFIFTFQLLKTKNGSLMIAAWIVVVCYAISIVMMAFFRPVYKRLEYEKQRKLMVNQDVNVNVDMHVENSSSYPSPIPEHIPFYDRQKDF